MLTLLGSVKRFKLLLFVRLSIQLLCHVTIVQTQNVSEHLLNTPGTAAIFYFMSSSWGDHIEDGEQICSTARCHWFQSDHMHHLEMKYRSVMVTTSVDNPIITAAVYNVHSLWSKYASPVPLNCDWRTNLTLATSEESTVRYHHLFNTTFKNFDGFSTNHPDSAIQRIHTAALLRPEDFSQTMLNFSSLIKAGSYGTCGITYHLLLIPRQCSTAPRNLMFPLSLDLHNAFMQLRRIATRRTPPIQTETG